MRKIGVFILFYFGTTLFMSCQDEKVKFMIPDEEMIKILTDLHISEAAILSLNSNLKDSICNLHYQQIFEIHGISDSIFYLDLEKLRLDAKKLEKIYLKVLDNIELLNVTKIEKDSTNINSKEDK